MRTTKLISISILPELLAEAERLAQEENRSRSELIREALRRYIADKKWEKIYRYGRMKAMEQGLTEAEVERLVDEYRGEQMNAESSN